MITPHSIKKDWGHGRAAGEGRIVESSFSWLNVVADRCRDVSTGLATVAVRLLSTRDGRSDMELKSLNWMHCQLRGASNGRQASR